ncbi:unnamed protein product, partial [Ixodes hexagonus]
MGSFMQKRFAGYATLCRIGGCLFIQNFRKKSLAKARATWKSPYTIYSFLCFCFFFWFEVAFLAKKVHVLTIFSRHFTHSLLFILHATVTFRIFINFSVIVAGSGKLLDFFRKAAIFEKSTGFSFPKRRRWPMPRRFLVLASMVISYVLGVHLFIGEVVEAVPPQWFLVSKLCGYIAGSGFFLYDSLLFVVTHCCTEVLVEYTHFQLLAFKDCDRTKGACSDLHASRQIEAIRLNLSSVRDLKNLLNDMWKWPLVAMCATMIFMPCVVLYSLFENGVYMRDIWVFLSYTVYSSLCFVEMTFVSQALSDELQRLKDANRAVMTTDASAGYVQQLRFLHETTEPVGMCLSGGGFFCLRKSLLVSMTASVITYTVILVQTSDDLAERNHVYDGFP